MDSVVLGLGLRDWGGRWRTLGSGGGSGDEDVF